MKSSLFSGIRLTLMLLVFFVGIYTTLVYALAQLGPNQGKGEIVQANGKVFYANIGQKFDRDDYFHSRPSAVDYNAAGSAGSNKAPSNEAYLQTIKDRMTTFLAHNPGIQTKDIPAELLTASGSGLDPDISVAAATVQIKRIAKSRNIPEANLKQLILSCTEAPLGGFLGPEKINVLTLNIALDELK